MSVAAQIAECPAEELVLDYADGRLAEEAMQQLELHFDACAACTSVLAALAHRTTIGRRGRSMARIHPGTTVDRYLVRRQIGRGSMGVVFEAHDPELDRRVALKVIRPPPGGIDAEERARVLLEARALARLSHPNVVPVLTVGARGDEIFVVMELVEGTTMRQWLAGAPRAWREVVEAYVAAGQGLAAAHRAGLVHRDFKPDNVLVGDDGRVRVIDFGLARLLADEASREESSSGSDRTGKATIVGTPAYMPPEQLLGGEVDARADQFALAASLYEGLAGRRPWEGTALVRSEGHAATRGIPRPILRALDKALSTRPEQRFATTDAFVRALERASQGSTRRVAIAAALGSLTIVGWVGLAIEQPSCGSDTAPTWADAGVRERVQQAFADAPAHAAGAATVVQRELDHRLAVFDDAASSACALTEPEHGRALACVDLRRRELDTAVELLAEGDPATLLRATEIVMRLEPASSCLDDASAEVVDAVDVEMHAELTRARLIGETGRFAEGLARAEAVWARAADRPRVRGHAAFVIGAVHEEAARLDAAAEWHETAYFAASEAGDDERAFVAAVALAQVLVRSSRFEDAQLWLGHAEAALDRHPSADSEAELAGARARLAGKLGHADESLAHFQRELELRLGASDADELSLADALDDVGVAYIGVGRAAEAIPHHERAIEIRERLLGERHPVCARVHNNLALALMELRDFERADDHYEWALELLVDAYGPEHLYVAAALGNLGAMWGIAGEPAVAASYFAAAQPGYEQLGPDHPEVATNLSNLGFAQLELGNWGEAVDMLERAFAIHEKAYGPDHGVSRGTAAALGLAHARLGNHARAVNLLEHAVATGAVPGWDESAIAGLRLTLEESRAHTGAASSVSPR